MPTSWTHVLTAPAQSVYRVNLTFDQPRLAPARAVATPQRVWAAEGPASGAFVSGTSGHKRAVPPLPCRATSGCLRSHETRIAGQVLSPISEIVRRYEYHRKRDAHPVVHSDTESYVACAGKERRHV